MPATETLLPHFYQDVRGWFTFAEIYRDAVAYYPTGSHFVEVGSWMGCSAAFMAVEIANSGKRIAFDCVDTWDGGEQANLVEIVSEYDIYAAFLANMERGGVSHLVRPIRMKSVEAAKTYADGSLAFCFIDAGHEYHNVQADIAAWWPKVQMGGVLAGHDLYDEMGVYQAVQERFGKCVVKGDSWVVVKREERPCGLL